jgi:hypothetical protein
MGVVIDVIVGQHVRQGTLFGQLRKMFILKRLYTKKGRKITITDRIEKRKGIASQTSIISKLLWEPGTLAGIIWIMPGVKWGKKKRGEKSRRIDMYLGQLLCFE